MGSWVPALARVSFYTGGKGYEVPRWLTFGSDRLPLVVLHQVEVGEALAGRPVQRVWLVRAGEAYFRIRVVANRVLVARWEGLEPPANLADLLA